MDSVDREMLSLLKSDGRMSYVSLGKTLGLTEGAVRHRVKKLTESGIIKRFTVEVSVGEIGALVLLKSRTEVETSEIADRIASFPWVVKVMEVAGEWDIVVHLDAPSTKELNGAIDALRRLNGVEVTRSMTILNTR